MFAIVAAVLKKFCVHPKPSLEVRGDRSYSMKAVPRNEEEKIFANNESREYFSFLCLLSQEEDTHKKKFAANIKAE